MHQARQQYGWTTTSPDYHAHLSMLSRTPSIHPDVPQYPNAYKAFNHKGASEEEEEVGVRPKHAQKKHPTKAPKKVHMSEHNQFIEQDANGNLGVIEESVDDQADGFIQQKRKGLELCKWRTFKF